MSKIAVTKEQQQVKLLEAKLTQSNREVQQLELKIKAMHQQHDELQSKNATILKQSYAQQGALRDKDKHEEQVRAMAGELAVTKSQLEATKGTIKALQMEREHLIARYNDDQQQWEKLAVEFGEKEDQFREEIEKCQEVLEDKDHVIQQQKTEILRHQQEMAEERRRISRIGTELTAEQHKAQKLETSLEDLTQEISEMGMKLTEATAQLNEQLEVTRRDRKEMLALKEKSDYLNHRVEQLGEESSRKDAIIADLKTAMLKRNGDMDDKDTSMRMAKVEMSRLQTEIDRLTKLNDQRVQMLSKNDTLLADSTAKLRASEDEALDLKERLRACELERMTYKDEAYKAGVSAKELTADLAALRDSLESKDGSARHLNEKIAQLERELATERNLSSAAKTRQETQVDLHKTQMEAKNSELARLKAEIASQQEHIDRIQQKHNTVDEDRVVLSNTMSELKTLLAVETATVKSLNDKLKEVGEALDAETKARTDAQAQVVFMRNEKASLQDEVSVVTNDRDTLKGKLAACEDLYKAEQSKNRVASTDGIALGLKYDRLTRELEHTQATLEEVKALRDKEVAGLEEDLGKLKTKNGRVVTENNELNNAARLYRDRSKALERALKEAEGANRRLTRECTAVNGRKEEYKGLARELNDRRERENDFNGRLVAFHKHQISALKENSGVLRRHLEGFIHFQKMVATAVAMSQSRMEDFVGEEVWNEVIGIQKSAEAEKVRAEAESAQLSKQYEALKAEYLAQQKQHAAKQQHQIGGDNNTASPTTVSPAVSPRTSGGDVGQNFTFASTGKENNALISPAVSLSRGASGTTLGVAGGASLSERNTVNTAATAADGAIASGTSTISSHLISKYATFLGGDGSKMPYYHAGTDGGRDVSASVRPPTASVQQGGADNRQTASQSTPRSLAVARGADMANTDARRKRDAGGDADVSPSIHRSAAPSNRAVNGDDGDGDGKDPLDAPIGMATDTSPRALKRYRAEQQQHEGRGCGDIAAVPRLQSVENVVSRSPAPITPRMSPSRVV